MANAEPVAADQTEQVIAAARSLIEHPDLDGSVTRWTLPRGVHNLSPTEVEASQRARIFYGVVHSVARKGYAASTIADICGLAKLSKTTFYQLFPDKESAFLSGYEAVHEELVKLVRRYRTEEESWSERMRESLRIYLAFNVANPACAKSFLLEIHAAGGQAWSKRDWGHDKFAELHRKLYEERRLDTPELPELPQEIFLAVIAALEEMVCTYLRRGLESQMLDLLPRALFIVEAVYSGHPSATRALELATA